MVPPLIKCNQSAHIQLQTLLVFDCCRLRLKLSYLLLVKVLDTHTVNTGSIFSCLISLQIKQVCTWCATGWVWINKENAGCTGNKSHFLNVKKQYWDFKFIFAVKLISLDVKLKWGTVISMLTTVWWYESHLCHCELMNVNFKLAVGQSQDDAGGLGCLFLYLLCGLQVWDEWQTFN